MSNNSSSPDVPPFYGYVETTLNALRLIHAARQGLIPRITRRLNDTERRTMINSGAVFVFSVEESGIKRWTDGLLWSPSRIVGNFLVYREIVERTSSRGSHRKTNHTDDSLSRGQGSAQGSRTFGYKAFPPPTSDQGTFKLNGLIKKTITVTIEGSDLHLISYYTSEDITSQKLKRPTSRTDIMALDMPPHLFQKTNFRNPPKVAIGPDGKAMFVCEDEDAPVDCKVEDSTYNLVDDSNWGSSGGHSPVDGPFARNPGSASLSPTVESPTAFPRYSERLPSDYPRTARNELPWPVPSSPTPIHNGRRSDGEYAGYLSQPTDPTWPTTLHAHAQPNSWQVEPYEPEVPSPSPMFFDRHRNRNSPYVNPILAPRRDHDQTGFFSQRYATSHVDGNTSHGAGSHRLPWSLSEPSAGINGRRNSNSGNSYSTSSLPGVDHFSPHGFHNMIPASYSSWPSNDSGTLDQSSSSSRSPGPSYYQTPYASGSSSLSSSVKDYANVDEYTKS